MPPGVSLELRPLWSSSRGRSAWAAFVMDSALQMSAATNQGSASLVIHLSCRAGVKSNRLMEAVHGDWVNLKVGQ